MGCARRVRAHSSPYLQRPYVQLNCLHANPHLGEGFNTSNTTAHRFGALSGSEDL